jgi:hypothetical protein
MTTTLNLKELERKAFRSTYQDGLWDIYQGGIILSFTAFAGGLDAPDSLSSWQRFLLFMGGVGLSYLIFWAGKRYITLPRIGQVQFGPLRQRRKRTLAVALGGIVAVQVAVVAFSVALWQIPALRAWLGISSMPQTVETLVVAVIGALFVGPSLALVAYFNDFPRGYFLAAVMSVSVFCLVWFDHALFMLLGGLLIIIQGIFLFARFFLRHPLPPMEMRNG